MGGGINTGEMLGKLEDMRAVVTEVNAQFKNPVRRFSFPKSAWICTDS